MKARLRIPLHTPNEAHHLASAPGGVQFLNNNKIWELISVVKVKVSDIIEANRSLISEAIDQYEKSRQELDMTELMTGQEVEEFLGISKTTRERWSKPDAFGQPPLLPKIKVGWQVRYKRSDVEQVKVKEDFKYGK